MVTGTTFQGIKLFPLEDKYLFTVLTEMRVVGIPSLSSTLLWRF